MTAALLALAVLLSSLHASYGRHVAAIAGRAAAVVAQVDALQAVTMNRDGTCTVSGQDLDRAANFLASDDYALRMNARALQAVHVPRRYLPASALLRAALAMQRARVDALQGVYTACAAMVPSSDLARRVDALRRRADRLARHALDAARTA